MGALSKRAITELAAGPKHREAIDAFFAGRAFPIVEGSAITFVYRGDADAVHLKHWVYGLPSSQSLTRIDGTNVWYRTLELPPASRVEYKLEVVRHGHGEWMEDPLNPNRARDPFGANSVAHGTGYAVPDWIHHDPRAAPGRLDEIAIDTKALGRRTFGLYLPARFRRTRRYPLLVVHDGHDYLKYASLGTILDNLIARNEIPDMIVALTSSPQRLVEYASDERHASFLTDELVPFLERLFPLYEAPQARCLMGASFGAVASLSTAWRRPGYYGRLLLQSGSFAFTDIGHDHGGGPVFEPVVRFVNRFRAAPRRVADRLFVSCGVYEPLIVPNRSMVPVFEGAGMTVRYVEARDGHSWENWRDRLQDGLSWIFPGAQKYFYE